MKALIHTKYGSPKLLELKECEKPSPENDELLIKVYATTVNRTDCAMLRAKPFIMRFFTGFLKPKNQILGTDFAGVVEAVGQNIQSFKIGDKVFGFDDRGISSHAEYMTIKENNAIAKIPENLNYSQIAACIEGIHYAINIINKTKLKKGKGVLVNGATGAIGSSTVQLLKHYGAEITATCKSDNIELVKSLGANKIIDYTQEDFTKLNETFDYVFDTVGKSTFANCKPLLNPTGVYISSELGPMIQNLFLPLITSLLGGKKVIFPIPGNTKASMLKIAELCKNGKLIPIIDKEYTMKEIPEAFEYVEKGQKVGNVVINY